jgi:hypothetical protein
MRDGHWFVKYHRPAPIQDKYLPKRQYAFALLDGVFRGVKFEG